MLGAAYSRIWFRIGGSSNGSRSGAAADDGKVWFFTPQQIVDGRTKKLFLRCTYDAEPVQTSEESATESAVAMLTDRDQPSAGSSTGGLQFDIATVADLVDPSKWSDDMDHLLISYLMTLAESGTGKRSAALCRR